ncbi:MAG: hypothetical protein CME61_04005 [Halobacteriovoraceae bacterium]|nr:hypothetical protein [Halobacteriovoraceae bacterium]
MNTLLKVLVFLFLASCAGITPLSQENWQKYYSSSFLSTIKEIIVLRQNDQWEEAAQLLMGLDEESLTSTEKAFRRNLIGVHFLNNKNFEKSLINFSQALSFEIDDPSLFSKLNLNTANANFQLGLFEDALRSLSAVKLKYLDKKSRKGFYELNYQIALYVEDRDLKQKSVIGVVMNLEDDPLSETEKERMQELRILVKKMDLSQKESLAEKFLEDPNIYSIKVVSEIIESLNQSSNNDRAKKLISVFEKKSKESPKLESLYDDLVARIGSLSSVDVKAIGVALPLSGKYKKFGIRILRGIELAYSKELINDQFRLIVEDTQSSSIVGKQVIQRLLNKHRVSTVIAGIEPDSATAYYEKTKKANVLYLSLSKVLTKAESKDELLIEVPGSIESEVSELVRLMEANLDVSEVAIVYPDNLMGEKYLKEFWRAAKNSKIRIADAVSFSPKDKDLRAPIKDLLGLKYKRERVEELEILESLYSKEKSVIRRVQKLKPLINYDWVFLPATPLNAAQIIPSFGYYDAPNELIVGTMNWESNLIRRLSKTSKGINFLSRENELDQIIKSDFKAKYNYLPKIAEERGILAISILKSLFSSGDLGFVSNRSELRGFIASAGELNTILGKLELTDGTWRQMFMLAHYRYGKVVKNLRLTKKLKDLKIQRAEIEN